MKKLLLLPLVASLFSVPVQAQQVNEYLTCKKYKETYTPGFYDNYGRYVQGSVVTQEYRANCQTGAATGPANPTSYQQVQYQQPYVAPRPYYNNGYYNNGGVYCNPTRTSLGALLGGGIAASMSRGNGYYWSVPVGAAIGGAIFGCNRY
jgi:hypothetical protein